MNEECRCPCHTSSNIIHCFPCCITCSNCGKHILDEYWKQHKEKCVVKIPEDVNVKERQ